MQLKTQKNLRRDMGKIKINEVMLERLKLNHSVIISKDAIGQAMKPIFNTLPDQDAINILFRNYVASEVQKKIQIQYPKDWWNAFKERWFPNWLKWRYPVIYRKHDFSPKVLYPFMKISLPNERRFPIVIESIEEKE